MPDKPMINKAPDQLRMGASVLQEALTLRQDAERALAEAGEVRSQALTEAADTLARATRAAVDLTESAEAEAEGIVDQAREQAIGIVTQAREEAAMLIAEAHADAAQYEAWARQEAQEQIRREFDGVRLSITDRRDDLTHGLDALQSAMERALTSLHDAERLSASLAERYEQGEVDDLDAGLGLDDGVTGATVVSLVRPVVDDDDDLSVDLAEEPADEPADESDDASDVLDDVELADEIEVVVQVEEAEEAELDHGELAVDDLDGTEVDEVEARPEVTQLRGRTRKTKPAHDATPDPRDALDEDARPLGWLFRSPPGV